MNRRTTLRRSTLAVALAGAVTVALAAPASAARVSDSDPADAASLNDLRRVVVNHGPERVGVQVHVTDLRRTSAGGPAGLSVFIDTDGSRRGPEFRLGTGLESGTDYQLVRMRDWRVVSAPLTCAHHVDLDFADDVVRVRAGRPCLGAPARVRVGVRMREDVDASHAVVDWLDGRRSFTSWVLSD